MRAGGLGAARIGAATVIAVLALAAPAGAGPGVTCRSGKTDFSRAGVRAFHVLTVEGNGRQEGSHYRAYYVCRRGNRHPFQYWGEPFTQNETVGDYQLVHGRLGFLGFSEGVSGGAGTYVGWVRVPGGPLESQPVNVREEVPEEEEPGPKFPSDALRYRLAADGSILLAGEGESETRGEQDRNGRAPEEWEVGLLAYRGGRLLPAKALLKTRNASEAPVLDSIAITASTANWRNRSGALISVPL